jgi:hypothetical protein
MILLLILVLTLLVVGIGGWAADTRDVDYGLWPVRRTLRPKPPATPIGPACRR